MVKNLPLWGVSHLPSGSCDLDRSIGCVRLRLSVDITHDRQWVNSQVEATTIIALLDEITDTDKHQQIWSSEVQFIEIHGQSLSAIWIKHPPLHPTRWCIAACSASPNARSLRQFFLHWVNPSHSFPSYVTNTKAISFGCRYRFFLSVDLRHSLKITIEAQLGKGNLIMDRMRDRTRLLILWVFPDVIAFVFFINCYESCVGHRSRQSFIEINSIDFSLVVKLKDIYKIRNSRNPRSKRENRIESYCTLNTSH